MKKKIITHVMILTMIIGVFGLSAICYAGSPASEEHVQESAMDWKDGTYQAEVQLSGGTGRASIASPAEITVKDGESIARLEWSSSNYDYMVVNGEKYLPVNTEGNSVFEIPVVWDQEMTVTADTVAMSSAHEIEYTLYFDSSTARAGTDSTPIAAMGVLILVTILWLIWKYTEVRAKSRKKKGRNGSVKATIWLLVSCFVFTACSPGSSASSSTEGQEESTRWEPDVEISESLIWESSMERKYAEEFTVDDYQGGYSLISISDGSRYLIVPEGKEAPEDLDEDVAVLHQPVDHIYLVASAVMDMFCSFDGQDLIRFSGTQAKDWHIPKAREAMESGSILYAGKYSAPDYERIVSEKCRLAIENTMIYHSPEVVEQLESFGIPVLVDHSSYESHPLGRMEWVKLYGVLADRREEAEAVFESQCEEMDKVTGEENTGKTVAFFYITANGAVNVRKSADYVPKMIELAGGNYVFSDLGEEGDHSSSTTMQMEEFYSRAREADYLVYNSAIEGEIISVEDLLEKSSLLKDFKAVKEGNVWCTKENVYQSSMALGTMISDFHAMLTGENTDEITYMYPLS